jgi:hypothetical protein
MVGKARSEKDKKQEARDAIDSLMERAVKLYNEEQLRTDRTPLGYRKVCDQVEATFRQETGRTVSLNHNTLRNRIHGMKSMKQFNSEKTLLTEAEEKIIVAYALESADRGFPLSHRRLREHGNQILKARLGEDCPPLGQKWSERFVSRHQDKLKSTWSRKMETNRGRAVNATNHSDWFELLGKTIEGVDPDCIWAADETGFQPSAGQKERVIGRRDAKTTYQQRGGSQENITVIVTISGAGTTIPPAVIFKGQAFLSKWGQNNPLKASYVLRKLLQ